MTAHPVERLRRVALAEAVSYLLLLGVAMPLKYLAGMPRAVTVVGLVHGVLFVAFAWALFAVWRQGRWPLQRLLAVFVASLLPVVPFVMDRRMRSWRATWPE